MHAGRIRDRLRHMLDAAQTTERLIGGNTLQNYGADPSKAGDKFGGRAGLKIRFLFGSIRSSRTGGTLVTVNPQ